MTPHRPHDLRRLQSLLLMFPLLAGGCNVLGVAAHAMPEGNIPARYNDLHGHSVAALVWLPRGLETDYPALRLDVTAGVMGRLQHAQAAGRGELKSATFPHIAASLVRFQQDHPELDRSPIVAVAPRLGVERLIYLEIENFQTRSDQTVELYRGAATVSLRVVEVQGGTARVAYEESGLSIVFPPTAPPEGIPGAGDARIYHGTVDLLCTAIAKHFYAHPSGK